MSARRQNLPGFTMIELIVALTMVAIIAASLSSVLWTAYHATRQTESAVTPSVQASIALDFLCQDLKNAIQPNITITTGTELAGDFEGTQQQAGNGQEGDDVVLYSTAESPQHVDANGDIKRVEYTIVQPTGGSDFVLVRRVTRNLLAEVTPQPDEEVICRGVNSFTVQYFDGSNWYPTWDSTQEDNTIPAAVQVTLELKTTEPNGKSDTIRYDRTVMLSASTASIDSNVNSGVSGL